MKKSEIVLLWVGGLWAVLWLFGIGQAGQWASGLARILAGWVVCALLWLSINKWPKASDNDPGIVAKLGVIFRTAAAQFPRSFVSGLGYVLALMFLCGWIYAREQVRQARLDSWESVAKEMQRLNTLVPESDLPSRFVIESVP
jgi:hypothetical protein